MRTFISTAAAFSLSLSAVLAEEKPKAEPMPFPGLKTLNISGGDGAMGERISYDAELSKVINKPAGPKEEGAPDVTRLLSTRLNRDSETRHFIDFDPGPSADPSFVVTDEKTGERVGSIGADVLMLPGNGFLYAMGRSNNMHLVRQKFAVRDGKLVEIEQPFLYVGLESKAKVPLTLTAKQGEGEVIANIPKGDALEVVLSDKEYLLVKTRFGLVGWFKMKMDVMPDNAEIEGIYYAGD